MNLADLLADQEEELARAKRVYGVATGVVTNNRDPKGLGRVKVDFRWLVNAGQAEWAKVASLMAGKERGTYFLPEVGDEVLVAFEQGDVNYPYVLGGLWSGVDQPPEENADGKNNIRKIRSRSGHEIIFSDDAEGKKEKIEIHTDGGHTIVLDDAGGSEKIAIRDQSGSHSIVMDSVDDKIVIESGGSLKLKAADIEIAADATISVTAGASLDLKGAVIKLN